MISVREERSKDGSFYHVSSGESKRIVHTSCIPATLENGSVVNVFYDNDYNVLREPSVFMLREMQWDSDNTKLQAISALKLLISFSTIINAPLEQFDMPLARTFLQFARGTLSEGTTYRFDLTTLRTEATLSAYLKIVRRYMTYLGVKDSPFLAIKKDSNGRLLSDPGKKRSNIIKADVRQPTEAPLHIAVSEYKTILKVVDEEWSLLERIVIRLMFEHGLRIGETLGLTLEDVSTRCGRDGVMSYSLILRNRLSDKTDQRAKTLMKIHSKAQYDTPEYQTRNVGFSEVFLSQSLFQELISYIELAHSDYEETEQGSTCAADSTKEDKANRYVFLNTKGRPLSANLWRKRLRDIFVKAGIPVDEGTRKTNLSHRFRHGYAMFLIYEEKLSEYDVMVLMRQRSLASIEPYNRPTAEDIRNMQSTVTASLEKEIFGDGSSPYTGRSE